MRPLCFTTACVVLWLLAGAADGAPAIRGVKALTDTIVFRMTGEHDAAGIVELRPHERYGDAGAGTLAWSGRVDGRDVTILRFHNSRDRLYSRFQLVDRATLRPLGAPRWADDLDALPAWDFPMPWPVVKKGVACPVDLEDLHALGARYTDTGVVLSGLFDWSGREPRETWEVDGEKLPINTHYVAELDRLVRRATELGINVTLIPVNGVPGRPEDANPLVHPRTDLANVPNHIGAFNLTDERGLRYYRAAMEYMAHRYSDPSSEHGWVSGYVIGNELQSHWAWHNMGRATPEEVTREYADHLRVAWLAVRQFHRSVRVYASMDHTWAVRYDPDPMKSMAGDWFLERLHRTIAREGDFPWHVAFHPYPQNLFEPRFWNDQAAELGFDAPRITFRNLEVLPAFLAQERFLYQGRPRRIILSEQGFHCPEDPEGEAVQAAAFAYAYAKISRMPTIDAFILFRHVDHRDHGPLFLGMWTRKLDSDDPSEPDRRRMIWEAFRAAGTGGQKAAFEFAKPIVGIADWQEALPYTGPIPRVSGHYPSRLLPANVVVTLWDRMGEARLTHCVVWTPSWGRGPDGLVYPAIFQHPPSPDDGPAEAAFALNLPRPRRGRTLELRFGTVLTGPSDDGVRMSVLVDGEQVWSDLCEGRGQPQFHTVDLTPHAGKPVELTLSVDALGNNAADWAHWLRPVIVLGSTRR